MTLPDAKALEKLLKVLRSQGVLQYATTELTLVLAETLPQVRLTPTGESLTDSQDESPEAEIERLMGYSDRPSDYIKE